MDKVVWFLVAIVVVFAVVAHRGGSDETTPEPAKPDTAELCEAKASILKQCMHDAMVEYYSYIDARGGSRKASVYTMANAAQLRFIDIETCLGGAMTAP